MVNNGADVSAGSTIGGRAWRHPWVALAVAAVGALLAAAVILWLPSLHFALSGWPLVVVALVDLLLLSAPLLGAVIVAARVTHERFAAATGLRGFSWIDLVAGLGVGLIARALVELAAPSAGGLGGGLVMDSGFVAATIVGLVGAVLVTPLVEELFFRGLLQRALGDALAGAGRWVAGAVAVLFSTALFAGLHALAAGAFVPTGLLVGTLAVGLGCGVLTLLSGRLAGALIAHVTFNAIGAALLLW
ncbi:CPBP family intramembrane metalloprotease [Microbacterium trichothecenolyticum]|uniref:CPBP family intramembrane glutamic endopeptidase n=1 Tax=Microbacterium trichothecenolyticum TaxID=69370 RepID=UPI001C6E647F|nr:CPBP family intramembrane glutamic endopeptidase [Microbacterium trichothecenolyticum]MBW9122406.1 CPBP family intramembrane metalloprotease [Microbacterium trichothecenolyticum]